MSMRYRLLCEKCGRAHPVETGQAGGTIFCECGTKIKIPSMLKIKRLEQWDASESASAEESASQTVERNESEPPLQENVQKDSRESVAPREDEDASGEKKNRWSRLSPRRRGLVVVAVVIFLACVFLGSRAIKKPEPIAVFYKQIQYDLGDGRTIRRDTTPITMEDYNFYFLTDYGDPDRRVYFIDDALIDNMSDFIAYQYLDNLKNLDLSDNFYDNYDALKTKRVLFLAFYGVLALLALATALYAFLANETKAQVGSARGSDWR